MLKNNKSFHLTSVVGMNDVLPNKSTNDSLQLTSNLFQYFENVVQDWAKQFGYQKIITPVVEQTDLFIRSIGEETDVVGKEMFYLFDKSLCLRPEGTASCLRSVVENDLTYNKPQKLWYIGPMFRAEKPQKGRYRQFNQLGIEAIGFPNSDIDAELIEMSYQLFKKLELTQRSYLTLEINNIGNKEERNNYRDALVKYLSQYENLLDEDSKRRLKTNPLRILDSKNSVVQDICNNDYFPKIVDYLSAESLNYYNKLKQYLDVLEIPYIENHKLVRGLDYYNQTVFEWTTDKLGSQATVCGGGRYDGLMEQLGGRKTPAIGFAIGVERLLLLMLEVNNNVNEFVSSNDNVDVFIINENDNCKIKAMQYARELRNHVNLKAEVFNSSSLSAKFKIDKQFKSAYNSGAKIILIIRENELKTKTVTVKIVDVDDNENDVSQFIISENELVNTMLDLLK